MFSSAELSDFTGGIYNVTLPREANTHECIIINITSDQRMEQSEEFSVNLVTPPGQQVVLPGNITTTIIVIEDPDKFTK